MWTNARASRTRISHSVELPLTRRSLEMHQELRASRYSADISGSSFVCHRLHGQAPTVARISNPLIRRHSDVVEEDLREFFGMIDLVDWSDGHPWRIHFDGQCRNTPVLGCIELSPSKR